MWLTRTDDTFRVTPAARLTPELLAELKRHKTELLALYPGGAQSGQELLERYRTTAMGLALLA
jgi:hypothetical protein